MAIADRKARERMEREQLMIDHADELLALHGYHGLNLDELASRIEYSKATIYNHFESKEDLVAAVDVKHLLLRAELFGRALLFPGSPRERIFVVGWADRVMSRMFPHWSSVHQLISTSSFHEKVTETRKKTANIQGNRCFSVAFEVIQQARQCGDLDPDRVSSSQILSGLISLSKGAQLLEEGIMGFPEEAGLRPLEMLHDNYHFFLDGVGWKPLHTEFDYSVTDRRIQEEVFHEELRALEAV